MRPHPSLLAPDGDDPLIGRSTECARLDDVLVDAVAGRSRALVLHGDAGAGKSRLLAYAAERALRAGGVQVVRGTGIESEAELPFGALHQMLHPHLDRIDALPAVQADALRAAFGYVGAEPPNRFLIGAATLTLLAGLAEEAPLLCLVDDAQWLDKGTSDALLFAARRFQADAVAVLFGVRESAVPFPTAGIDVLEIVALPPDAAADLLDRRTPGLAEPVRRQVLAESSGNPLALIELGAAHRHAEESGRLDLAPQVAPLPVTRRVQEAFRVQIADLPGDTGAALVVAAADTAADLGTIMQVCAALGLPEDALAPAEDAALLTVGDGHLAFRHPLVRAAAYQAAPHHRRIEVHRAFAAALARTGDADRRTWHLAASTTGPDEEVAAELERTAERAARRGGVMAVSVAYDRAGRLSVDRGSRAQRTLKAARAAYDAGRFDRAARLAAEAGAFADDIGRAEATHIRAMVEYERTSPAADAALTWEVVPLVLDGTRPDLALLLLTEVIGAGRDGCDHDLVRKGVAALAAQPRPRDALQRASVEAQLGWGHLFDGRPDLAAGPMRAMIEVARTAPFDQLQRIVAGLSGVMLGDDDSTVSIMRTMLDESRSTGAMQWIPYSTEVLGLGLMLRGDLADARVCVAEGITMGGELEMGMELVMLRGMALWLAAVAGDEAGFAELDALVPPDGPGTHRIGTATATWARGLRHLGAARPADAYPELLAVCSGPARRDLLVRAVPDLVEAAVRSGRGDDVGPHLRDCLTWGEHAGPRAAALAHRARGLADGGARAEEAYATALDLHDRAGGPFDRARTELVYGEWLRRRRRRSEARARLVAAAETFRRLGAGPWHAQAVAELAALGESPVGAGAEMTAARLLSPQEVQVVRLAAAGLSNKEIGAQLFLSPRTVGHHLYKAYPKLGVTRRAELGALSV